MDKPTWPASVINWVDIWWTESSFSNRLAALLNNYNRLQNCLVNGHALPHKSRVSQDIMYGKKLNRYSILYVAVRDDSYATKIATRSLLTKLSSSCELHPKAHRLPTKS